MKSSCPSIQRANFRADRLAGFFEPATVVLFAGLGGACIGIEKAYVTGGYRDKYIDLCVNHWDTAVAVHELNHPMTQHLHADVWEVDPDSVLPGRSIAYLHLSPDCTDFSKAKGDRPKRKHIRALADVGIVWARKRRPTVLTLENVEEFEQWGPLNLKGKAHKRKRGHEFDRWIGELRAMDYVVEYRRLVACKLGVPTTRKRLFIIARCDGKPIVWPEDTHASDTAIAEAKRRIRLERMGLEPDELQKLRRIARLKPYNAIAGHIDWSQPMLSIFATRAEARAWAEAVNVGRDKKDRVGVPQRPLAPKTHNRLAGGFDRWVLGAAEPFIVNIANYGWDSSPHRPVSTPLDTVTAGPRGGKHAAVDIELASFAGTFNHSGGEHRTADLREPLATVVGANEARGVVGATVSPFTVPRYGEAPGQAPRSGSINRPFPTVTPTSNEAQLVAVAINKHFGGVIGHGVHVPLGTVTGIDHHSILAATLVNYHGEKAGEVRGQRPDEPLRTLDTQNRFGIAGAFTAGAGGATYAGKPRPVDQPLNTVMSNDRQAVIAAYLSHMYSSSAVGGQGDPSQPIKTVTGSGNHAALCVVYLSPFYGSGSGLTGHTPAEPLPTAVGQDRFAVVSLETSPHWIFTPSGLRRAKQVARWAIRHLKSKVEKNLLWVSDAAGKKFPLLSLTLKGSLRLVTDIAMRMFRPRELARAQGFEDSYIIDRTVSGKPVSKADQVKLIGNSVPPAFMEAICRDNVVGQGVLEARAVA